MVRTLQPGCYAPIPTFFDANEDLDVETFTQHVVSLAKIGMFPVIAGSMGEAHHLTLAERTTLITSARKALDAAGLTDVPIIAGTGLGSTRATIEVTKQAAADGADVAIVISSGYYAGALDKAALVRFFVDVAEASPIPVMVYNYPGASGNIDLSSDDIIAMKKGSRNISSVKLTCGAVGKLTRITGETSAPDFKAQHGDFLTLGGFADFILPSVLGAQAHGAIMGLGNLYPHAITRLFALSTSLLDPTLADWRAVHAEALALQTLVSAADAIYAPAGIAGTKATLALRKGFGGIPRKPLLPFPQSKLDALEALPAIQQINKVEADLAAKAK